MSVGREVQLKTVKINGCVCLLYLSGGIKKEELVRLGNVNVLLCSEYYCR